MALRLGCCVLFTELCDQRGILQHLLSALLSLLTVVAGAAASDCSIEGGLLPSSSDGSLPGGAVRLTVSELSWLAGSGVVVLNFCSATMYGLRTFLVDWARELRRPPTASPVILGTGVLWVSTGTHPCGSPSRQDDGETRAPALHTLDDVLRFRGDEEHRAVLLQD